MTAPTNQVTASSAQATATTNGTAKDAKPAGDGFDAMFAAMFAQMQAPQLPNTVMKLGPNDGPASHPQFPPPNSVMKVDPTNGNPLTNPNGPGGTVMKVGPTNGGPTLKSNATGGTIMQIGPNGSDPNLKSNATGGTIMQIGPNGSDPNLKSNATGGTIMQIGPNGSDPNLKSNATGGTVMKLDPPPRTGPSASPPDLTGPIDFLKPLQTQPNASQGSVILMDHPPVQTNTQPDTGKRPLIDPNANGSVVMKVGPPPPLVVPNAGGNTKMIDKPQPKSDQADHPDDGNTIDKVTPPSLSTHAADPNGPQPQTSSHASLPDHGQGPQPNADGKPQIMQITPPQGVAPNATSSLGGTVMKDTPPATMPAATPDMAALATNIAAKVKDGEKQFDIRLDPPDFGRVDVRLSVSSDGKAQAHVTADTPQTLDLLQRDQATLHRALQDTGLDLGNNSLNFSLKGQDRGDGGAGTYQQQPQVTPVVNDAPDAIGSLPIYASQMSDSRVDIRI